MQQQPINPNALISTRDVKAMLGNICTMTLWRWQNADECKDLNFPSPIRIQTRNYWRRGVIENWINKQQTAA